MSSQQRKAKRSGTRGSWGFFVCFNWILIQFNQQRDATTMTHGRGKINVCYGKMTLKWNRQSIIISLAMSRRSDKHQIAVHISRVLIFITLSSAFDFRISFRFSLICKIAQADNDDDGERTGLCARWWLDEARWHYLCVFENNFARQL